MADSLNDIVNDLSDFISLTDGQSFEGKYVGALKIPSPFDNTKETIELQFDIGGKVKTMTGARLAREMLKTGVKEKDTIKITRVSTKGTKVEWKVEKIVKI